MSAVGYASMPVTLSFANAAKAVQSQLKPQLDKLAKDAAAGIDKNVGSAVDAASKKVERARQRETKATEAATQAESKLKAETEKREGALKRVEAATLNLETAQRKSADAVAKAQAEYDKLVSSGTASAEQLAAAERKIADARDKGKADVLKRETQLDNARSALTTQTQRVADAEVKLKGAKEKAAGASERVLSATKQLDEAQAQAERSSKGLSGALASMGDAASAAAEKSGGFLRSLGRGIGKVGGLAAALAGLSGAVGTMQAGFAKVTSIEDTTASLGILMGSAEQATKVMDSLQESNQGTPYSFDAWADAGKNLIAFGVEADKVSDIVTGLGEAASASGKGEDALNSMASAFGKAAASGKISMDTINSLAEGGVQGLAIMANHYGVTTEEMQKKISSGAIEAAEGIDILTKGILEGSEGIAGEIASMSGVMGQMAETTSGRITNMKAAFNNAAKAMFEEINPLIGALALKLTDFTYVSIDVFKEQLVPAIKEVVDAMKAVGEWVSRNSDWLGALAVSVGTLVGAYKLLVLQQEIMAAGGFVQWVAKAVLQTNLWTVATNAQAAAQKALNLVMNANPIMLVVTAIAALTAGLVYFFTQTETGQRLWAQFTQFLQSAFQSASDAVVDAITWLIVKWNEAQQAWDAASAAMRAAADWLRDKFNEVITSIVLKFIEWQNNVNQVITVIKALFQQFADKVRESSNQAVSYVREIPGKIKDAFSGARSWLVDSGRQMIQGLIDGIQSMAGRVGDAVRWVVPDSVERFIPGLHFGGVVPGFARGGVLPDVPGIPRSARDPILGVDGGGVPVARVEPGEFIVNREDTAKHLPLLRAINSGRINPAQGDLGLPRFANGGVVSARQLLAFADGQRVNGQQAPRSLEGIPYVWGGGLLANWGDCSGAMSGLAALAAGVSVAGRKFATGTEGQWLGANGFTRGTSSGRNAFEIGYFNDSSRWGGHTAGTIFDENGKAVNVEMGGGRGNGQIGGRAAGSRHPQFTDRYYINLPAAAGAAVGAAAAEVLSTSVEGVTVAAPEKSLRQAKTYQIDWGTASQLASKYDTDTHRDAALREYLSRRAKVYDTGGILPTGGVAVNLGKPELIFPAEATTAMLQMARQTPQFAQAMEQLAAAAPQLAAAVDKFTDLDYGVIAEEVTAAWRNEDFGYGELARAIGDEAAERIVTEIAFIGDQIRDMQDGSNMRAYLANMRPSEAVGLADQVGQLVGIKSIGSTFGGVAKGYEALQDAAVMQVDAADAVTQAEKNLTDARREYAEMLKEAGGDPEVSVKTTRKIEDAERKLKEAKEAPRAKNDKDGSAQAKKIADAERNLSRVREDAAAELEKNGVKNADQLVKASEAVTAAEQEREKALGVVQMAARATGQAQIAMALEVAEMVINIGKKIWDVVVKIADWINNIRIQTRTAVWELTKSWSELTGVVDQHRDMVAQLQMQLVNAALDVIGKSMEMRTAQVDVVRAQLEGAKNVAEAEAALQGERDKVMGKQKWNFRDMSLEYDRFRQGYRDGINEQIAGMAQLSVQERDRIMATIGGVGRLSDEERARLVDAVAGMSDLTVEERERIVAAINGNGELTAADRARLSAAIAGMTDLSAADRERMQSALTGIGSVTARERDRILSAMDGLVTLTAEERARLSASVAGMSELSERERARVMVSLNGVGQLTEGERDRVRQAVGSFDDLTAGERERINSALAGVGTLTVEERARVANAIAGMSGLSEEERERIIRAVNGVSEVAQEERLRVVAALTGIGSIHGKEQDLTRQIVANADKEGLAAKLGLDAKLAAQKAADDAYIASVNGREVGERELHQMYKLQLAEQLVGEQAFQNLKDASLDAQLEWQRRVDKAAQLGLEHELKARAAVTPEILALQREVYAAEFAQQKSILDAQIKGIEATFAQQQALVSMGRLQEDLIRQQAELDRLSGQTMGMNQGQAIVMEEIARLQKENAEILGKRNSAAAGARNFFGRIAPNSSWGRERAQYDAAIAANNRQIEELKKSQYAKGAFTPAQQRQIDAATKLAAKYFAQGNEAAAKAALQASPLGNAQRSLEVNKTLSRITDWEKQQRDLQREQKDMLAEFKKNTQIMPLQWRSQELESRESAQRYAADALRSDNAGVRDALATLSRLEESNAAELKQLREKPRVVNVTVPGPRDGVTTIGEMEDALVALAGELGVTRTDVKRLNEARRTSASDRVRAAIGR
nr:MAG TPA: tail tape measure [Caudoviricetes sp.]